MYDNIHPQQGKCIMQSNCSVMSGEGMMIWMRRCSTLIWWSVSERLLGPEPRPSHPVPPLHHVVSLVSDPVLFTIKLYDESQEGEGMRGGWMKEESERKSLFWLAWGNVGLPLFEQFIYFSLSLALLLLSLLLYSLCFFTCFLRYFIGKCGCMLNNEAKI